MNVSTLTAAIFLGTLSAMICFRIIYHLAEEMQEWMRERNS